MRRSVCISEGKARDLGLLISLDRLKSILRYEPETGRFFWIARPSPQSRVTVGHEAGCVLKTGYCFISVDRVLYYRHRLAWFYQTGQWPTAEIDHRCGKEAGDNFENLRPADRRRNQWNSSVRKSNRLGVKGVFEHRGRFHSTIKLDGKSHYLGSFATEAEARAAYETAAVQHFGEFATSRGNRA